MSGDDEPAWRVVRGVYRRIDGSLATWGGVYDECGALVVEERVEGYDDDDGADDDH